MHLRARIFLLIGVFWTGPLLAQMPFYTDNADVTDEGTLHFEFFNEYDGLQSAQYPDLRQNTFNLQGQLWSATRSRIGCRCAISLHLPRAGIADLQRARRYRHGHQVELPQVHPHPLSVPALSASLYIEFPTGDTSQQLGSGLTDYWLNSIAQEPLTEKTRLNANFGFLFAGNTSTGVLGTQNHPRSRLYRRPFAAARLQSAPDPGRGSLRRRLLTTTGWAKTNCRGWREAGTSSTAVCAFTFALLGGSHIASPRSAGRSASKSISRFATHPPQINFASKHSHNWRTP